MSRWRQRESWTLGIGLLAFVTFSTAGMLAWLGVIGPLDTASLGILVGGALGLSGVGGWSQVRRAHTRSLIQSEVSDSEVAAIGFSTPYAEDEDDEDEFGPER